MPSLFELLSNVKNPEPLKPDPSIPEELFLLPTGYEEKTPSPYAGFTDPSLGKVVLSKKNSKNSFRTRTHEAAHGTQNATGMVGQEWNNQWKRNTDASHAEFMGKLANRAAKIQKIYPEIGPYLSREYLQEVTNPTGLQEVMAALHEHERAQGPQYDLTKDPVFEGVFDEKTSAAYRAMSGMRNLRTDPKDPPPAQVTNENWYRR